jgi:ComF family protein
MVVAGMELTRRLGERARLLGLELRAALFPPVCWLCRRAASLDGFGCAAHALEPCRFDPSEARCAGCAALLPTGIRRGPCARCRRSPRGYRALVAAGPYREPGALREWVLALKHGGRRELATPLAAFLAEAWRRAGGPPPGAVLVPVPLHALRRLERGHDQARRLAEELASELGLELVPALRRARWTAPQGAAGVRSRAANVADAFVLRRRLGPRLAGRELWLVDDVVTSGATLAACARALRSAQPRSVSGLCLARAEPRAEDLAADADLERAGEG